MDPHFPALPIGTEPDAEHVLVQSDGSVREHYNLIYSEEDKERIRLGYCCIHCGESQVDHDAPFPENCWVCGYQMRDKQMTRYGMEFRGSVRVGPQTSLEDELSLMEELEEKQELARRGFKKTSSIIVPGWARA